MIEISNLANEFLFSPACLLCEEPVLPREVICPSCQEELRNILIRPPFCVKCGGKKETLECRRCKEAKFLFEFTRGVYLYRGKVRELLEAYKYRREKVAIRFIVEEMERKLREFPEVDLITNVPSHSTRKRERGFCQTELISKELSLRTGIEYKPLLLKRRRTKPQVYLGMEERRRNVKDSFEAVEEVKAKRILIIDDVLTTGSTINEATKELRRKGASKVYGLVFAIAESPST